MIVRAQISSKFQSIKHCVWQAGGKYAVNIFHSLSSLYTQVSGFQKSPTHILKISKLRMCEIIKFSESADFESCRSPG